MSTSFTSSEISSLHSTWHLLPLIDIYDCSQGAKSTFALGNVRCTVEEYNKLFEGNGNVKENVTFRTFLNRRKNAKRDFIRQAKGDHRWHQKDGPYTVECGWIEKKYTLSHQEKPCREHGFTFHMCELTHFLHEYPEHGAAIAVCRMTRTSCPQTTPTNFPQTVMSAPIYGNSSASSSHQGLSFHQGLSSDNEPRLFGPAVTPMLVDDSAPMLTVPSVAANDDDHLLLGNVGSHTPDEFNLAYCEDFGIMDYGTMYFGTNYDGSGTLADVEEVISFY